MAVRLRVYDSGLCFICAHLASGEAEGDELKRNYDYSEIVRRGQFPADTASLDPDSDITGSGTTGVSQVLLLFASLSMCTTELTQLHTTGRAASLLAQDTVNFLLFVW